MDHDSEFSKQPHEELIIAIIIPVVAGRAGEGGKARRNRTEIKLLAQPHSGNEWSQTPVLLITRDPLPTASIRQLLQARLRAPAPRADTRMERDLLSSLGTPGASLLARKMDGDLLGAQGFIEALCPSSIPFPVF